MLRFRWRRGCPRRRWWGVLLRVMGRGRVSGGGGRKESLEGICPGIEVRVQLNHGGNLNAGLAW